MHVFNRGEEMKVITKLSKNIHMIDSKSMKSVNNGKEKIYNDLLSSETL